MDVTDIAVDWLLRLRQLQGYGLSFSDALAVANQEADAALAELGEDEQ